MKINCIIQARMTSERFPGKVMYEIGGKPLIGHLLDRIVGSQVVDEFIVAIPNDEAQRPLSTYLISRGDVGVIQGSEHNVAARFCNVLRHHPCDAFLRICADSPCLDMHMVDYAAASLLQSIYIHFSGGISGTQIQGIQTDVFLAFVDNFNEEEREHVLSFFENKLSLAVDRPEDIENVRPILENRMEAGEWLRERLRLL